LGTLKGSEHWLRRRRRLTIRVDQEEKGDYPGCGDTKQTGMPSHDNKLQHIRCEMRVVESLQPPGSIAF
jgi:hypothetical protein